VKLIGNYKEWVTSELLDILLDNDGDITPVYQPDKWKGTPEFDLARIRLENAGYPAGNHAFCQYTKDTECLKHLNIKMPIPISGNTHWWIIKLKPGQMQPMHFDPHVIQVKNCYRWTMPLLDYEPGHVFVWDNKLLTDYKAGDLFLWDDPMCYHGVVNISMNTRLTLQISSYDID
jgi:hypothetical protein